MRKIILLIVTMIFFCGTMRVFADSPDIGVGDFATGLMTPMNIVANLLNTASLIVGVCFLFAALFRYLQYRINPLASPIGHIIFLIILGVVLICLPMLYKFTEYGISYSLG